LTKRGNSEGSLYQSADGWRGYVWCTRPDGTRYRKYVRGKTYEEVRQNWVNLRDQASRGPVSADVPKLAEFLAYWLKKSWGRTSRLRHTRNTRCSAACISFRTSAASAWTKFK
jgi:hypothetical protein